MRRADPHISRSSTSLGHLVASAARSGDGHDRVRTTASRTTNSRRAGITTGPAAIRASRQAGMCGEVHKINSAGGPRGVHSVYAWHAVAALGVAAK